MKNFGQKPRKIKVHKRYTLSPFVLNLTDEAKKWAECKPEVLSEDIAVQTAAEQAIKQYEKNLRKVIGGK